MTPRTTAAAAIVVAALAKSAVLPWVPSIRTRSATAARSLMPWSALAAIPLAAAAAATRHRRVAVAAGAVGAGGLAMAARLVVPRRQAQPDPMAATLRITHANLLYVNRLAGAVPGVLAPLDADVVTFSELTPTHLRRLHDDADLAARYPHRVELPARLGAGTGLWSRHPVHPVPVDTDGHHTIVADIDVPGGPVQVIVIHTWSPIEHDAEWRRDLAELATFRPPGPAVMIGDFNATWWHPELRDVMRAGRWRDAHQVLGRGLSCSWPNERWNVLFRVLPRFVRLDHALVNDGLVVTDTGDFDIPGSDHRGVVVTVRRARPAGP